MKWQWRLGRFFGIDVYVHATFLILIGWMGLNYWLESKKLAAVLIGIGFILALFLCVVLHEYGHALTARKYGIKTRDITLYPIGGVARLERMPDRPIEELWVALMGPAVNVVIALLLFIYLAVTIGAPDLLQMMDITTGGFLERLMRVNITLVLFNLIPAFPMDGGRVLRAALAMRMDYVHATQTAAAIGQGLAFLFGFIGLFTNPFLLFIAFFVWIGAGQEANLVQVRNSVGGIPVSRAMQTKFESLSSRDTMARVVELILAGAQQDFPVVEDGQVIGLLTREAFIQGLSKEGSSAPVIQFVRRDLPEVDSHDMVETALMQLERSGSKTLTVKHNGQLVGLITSENITEFLMIRSALRSAGTSPA
jgi:Zn-dependent protease